MDLNRLALFTVVAEELSFATAARRLGVERSSVSRAIAALEESLAVTLFQRTTRQVALTPEGAALYSQVAPQLAALRDAVRSVPERDDEPSGTLRITTTVDFGTSLLLAVVQTFVRRYPHVRIELAIHNRVVDLVKEGFDAALRPQRAQRADSSLVSRKLFDLTGHLYASPGYLAARGTPREPADLAAHDCIGFRHTPWPSPVPPLPPPRIQTDEMMFVREAARAGLGIGMIADLAAQADVLEGRLVRVLSRQVSMGGTLYLIHPPARHIPRRLALFRDHLLEHIAHGGPGAPAIGPR
jgi:DNA-binding transcriptional LysR family regulator